MKKKTCKRGHKISDDIYYGKDVSRVLGRNISFINNEKEYCSMCITENILNDAEIFYREEE